MRALIGLLLLAGLAGAQPVRLRQNIERITRSVNARWGVYVKVLETGEEIAARERPVVIITSNNEKELPDAFLRRCVFHFIAFPDASLMKRIVAVHHPNLDSALLDQGLIKFYWLREQPELRKKPSTSELIDWLSGLRHSGIAADKLEAALPFAGVLLKQEADLQRAQRPAVRR